LSFWMSELYLCSPGQALSVMVPSGKRETESSSFTSEGSFKSVDVLHPQQEEALRRIREAKGCSYLYGVTGSGKSEVFLRAAEDVISKGKQAIYLVPEITLTHQLSEDVAKRFHGRVALLHSGLTPSERLKYWHMIMNGEVDLIIGARSAVFAPSLNLGLIIMDEEHEGSYKSGNTPRYHARQIAEHRAKSLGIPFIMGSATPSLEAYGMMKRGIVERIDMPERVSGGSMPQIEVVNMLREDRCISRTLEDAIRKSVEKGHGAILFLNRRGYTYYYHCNSCGCVVKCPNCSVALTYHKSNGLLECHYCGHTEKPIPSCPECGSTDMSVSGFGTERVEEEARRLFPSYRIARLDSDVAEKDKESVKRIIDDFKEGGIDMLLGTQMVAKGLNFPLLETVGVILADSTLSVPDFRAEERTFSLLEQVAGRAGRYRTDGRVIIQTYRPDDDAIKAVLYRTQDAFYEKELSERRMLSYPPFSRLIQLVLRGRTEENVKGGADRLASVIERVIDANPGKTGGMRIIGVNPCIIERKASNWRYQILLSGVDVMQMARAVKASLNIAKLPSSIYAEIDVDPLSLL